MAIGADGGKHFESMHVAAADRTGAGLREERTVPGIEIAKDRAVEYSASPIASTAWTASEAGQA